MATSLAALSSAVAGTCNQVLAAARALDRNDLTSLITTESARWNEADTTVVIAGEPGTGKSALAAALCGRRELAIDGPTVVYSVIARPADGEAEHIVVHRAAGSEPERYGLDQLSRFVSGTQNPDNVENVSAVHVAIRSDLLESGIVLVDTPGVDGLDGRWGALTLCATGQGDHLLLATGADAPLTLPELRFLERASTRLDSVDVVLTRTDRFRGWSAIAEDDRTALGSVLPRLAGVPIVPVAAQLELESLVAAADGDADLAAVLAEESRVEPLRFDLRNRIANRVRFVRLANLSRVGATVVDDLLAHLAVGDDVTDLDHLNARLASLKAQTQSLRESSPAWSTALSDDLTLLRDALTAELQSTASRLVERIDTVLASGVTGDELEERLQVEFRISNLELSSWMRTELEAITSRHADRCSGTIAAPETPDLAPEVTRPGAPSTSGDSSIRLRIATAMSTTLGGLGMMAVTSVGAVGGDASQAGLFRLGTLAVSVLVGSASAAFGVRNSQRQQRVSAARLNFRAELDAWRVAAANQARAALLVSQRTLETETKALLRDRQAALAAETEQVKSLIASTSGTRAAAATRAASVRETLTTLEAELADHHAALVAALEAPGR